MNLRDFLARVTPSGNKYAARLKNHSGGGTYFWHTSAANHDDLAELIRTYAADDKMDEIYYALASFRMALIEKNGKMRPHRTQDNVDRLKSLWVDVDIGPKKEYASRKDAIEALQKWLLDEHIYPPTIIVDSGGGYHLYWSFTETISTTRWKAMSEALKASGQKAGFKADWKCTIDSARVLRPPETINFKDPANPRKVTIIKARDDDIPPDDMANNLQRYMNLGSSGLGKGPGLGNANEALSAGIYHATRTYKMGPIIQNCPVMTHVADTHGEESDEPFWMAALQLAMYCEDGKDWIHTLSDGHPGYTVAKTEAKYQKLLDIKDDIGPTLCKNFEDSHPAGCAGCPFRGRIQSPIIHGDKEEGDLPWPYSRNLGKIYRQEGEDKEGNPKTQFVCDFDIEEVEMSFDDRNELSLFFWQILSATRREYRKLSVASIGANNPTLHMVNAGIIIANTEHKKRFAELMTTFAQQLQRSKVATTKRHTPYGWTEDGKHVGFSMNGTTRWDDGSLVTTNPPKRGLGEIYAPCGQASVWMEAAGVMRPTMSPELELLLATAFAGPLVSKVSPYSTILCFRSNETGVGKTMVLKLAQAVWGNPSKAPMQLNDTANAIANTMGSMGNYPSYWDEVRIHNNVASGLDLLMQIGQGREKRRLTASSELMSFGSWHSLLVMTTNESLLDHIRNANTYDDAAVARTFEISIRGKQPNNAVLNRKIGKLDNNFGKVGEIYADHLLHHHTALEKTIATTLVALDKVGALKGNRFASATLCAILVGAAFASSAGIYQFDAKRLYDTFVARATEVVEEQSEIDLLGDYLGAHQHQGLIVATRASRGPNNKVSVLAPPRSTHEPVAYQVIKDSAQLIVPGRLLHKFGYSSHLTTSQMRDEVLNIYGGVFTRVVVGGGTPFVTVQGTGYIIPITGELEWLLSGV